MRNPYGVNRSVNGIDYHFANQWITLIMSRLIEGDTVLADGIDPSVRDYVLIKLGNCPTVQLDRIGEGDNRIVLWYQPVAGMSATDWVDLSEDHARSLPEGSFVLEKATGIVYDCFGWSTDRNGLAIGHYFDPEQGESTAVEDLIPQSMTWIKSNWDRWAYYKGE